MLQNVYRCLKKEGYAFSPFLKRGIYRMLSVQMLHPSMKKFRVRIARATESVGWETKRQNVFLIGKFALFKIYLL